MSEREGMLVSHRCGQPVEETAMDDARPRVESARLPREYGVPRRKLRWPDVAARLTEAEHYWLASTRPDGRPHTIPIDGLWHEDRMWFGGSAASIHHENLSASGAAILHVEDAMSPIIVEGTAELLPPTREQATSLAGLSAQKYGYGAPVEAFLVPMWRLRPERVLAWTSFPADATRFVFPPGAQEV